MKRYHWSHLEGGLRGRLNQEKPRFGGFFLIKNIIKKKTFEVSFALNEAFCSAKLVNTVEVLWTDTLVSGQLYLQPP